MVLAINFDLKFDLEISQNLNYLKAEKYLWNKLNKTPIDVCTM